MPIYLPQTTVSTADSLTPRQIVAELDKFVVGQAQAKRAVAVALRNRMRRQKLSPELAEEFAELLHLNMLGIRRDSNRPHSSP